MQKVKNFFSYISRHRAAYLMVAPLMIGVLVFCYYPPIYGILLSFTDKTARPDSGSFIGFQNYVSIFSEPDFLGYFWIMAKLQIPRLIAGIVVPLVFAEIVFHLRSTKAQAVYRILILLPVVAPGVVSTLVWKQIYASDGLFNEILHLLHLIPQDVNIKWLNDTQYVIFAILFMGFPWIGGTQVLIYLAGIMNIPKDLFEAADLDGATAWQKIFKIHIYLISGQIRYFLIFGIIGGLQDYGTQVVLTEGGPAGATTVPGYYMFKLMDYFGYYGKAAAVGVILFVLIMIFTVISFKFVKFGDSKDAD